MITQYFRSITVGANTVLADTHGSDLLLIAGNNISLAANTELGQLTVGISPGASFPISITSDNSTNATNYVIFNNASSGDLAPRTDTDFYYNPSTGILSVTGIRFGDSTTQTTSAVPALSTVLTKTADYTIAATDAWIINNKTGSALTLTFPTASSWTGRSITVKNMQTQLVNSAASNIVPLGSTTAGTAVLLAVIGNWATLVSDGTNWVIMQAAPNNSLLAE